MAAGNTYTPIATQTLSTSAASVTFSSISGAYTDLILIVSATATSADDLFCRVNSDTGGNYSFTFMSGNGTTSNSVRNSSQTAMHFDYNGYIGTASPNTEIIHFMNYSNTTTYKTTINRASNGATGTDAFVNLWRNTAAINSIYLFNAGGASFATGSTFTLYGIAAA